MEEDVPAELRRLQDGMIEVARQLLPDESPDARYTGTDPNRKIRITVDASGKVSRIDIERDWKRHIPPMDLGATVIQAIQAAADARMTAWMERASAGGQGPSAAAEKMRAAADSGKERVSTWSALSAGMDDYSRDRALDAVGDLLRQLREGLDDTQAQLARQIAEPRAVRTRHVLAAVTGSREVVSVKYDQRWLSSAHEIEIARETQTALDEAYEAATEHSPERLLQASPFGEPARVLTNPRVLAERLGLH